MSRQSDKWQQESDDWIRHKQLETLDEPIRRTDKKRTQDYGKTEFAIRQHEKRDEQQRLGREYSTYDVPDNAKRVGQETEAPGYYTTSASDEAERNEKEDNGSDIVLTDYPSAEPITDMSKAPLFFGKPGQFEQITTWCEINHLTNDELAQDKRKQAAHFASLFRGPVLTWFAKNPHKESLLQNYVILKEAVKVQWDKSDAVKEADAARRISTIYQRKAVSQYALEFTQLADTLKWPESARIAQFKRGLKKHVKEALVSSDNTTTFEELVAEAERIDAELYSIRRPFGRGNTPGRGGFKGKCNSCGQFGHKARDCKKDDKRNYW